MNLVSINFIILKKTISKFKWITHPSPLLNEKLFYLTKAFKVNCDKKLNISTCGIVIITINLENLYIKYEFSNE